MDQIEFAKAISDLPLVKQAFFSSIGSTNDVVAEWARQGVKGLALAAADEQTRGRGRAGRRWLTPAGSALAFSLLLDLGPGFAPTHLARASGLGALGVCEALERMYTLTPKIKWPNDVLLDGKKTCGVLSEAHWTGGHLQALILGIGINIAPQSVPAPDAINFPATSIRDALGKPVDAGGLLRAVIERIIAWKEYLGTPEFIKAWEDRLAYLEDSVYLELDKELIIEAQVEGLAIDGSLRLRLPSGEMRAFQIGEIQIRPPADKK
ncbi:MAG: biotin--[acetyl-CoA-carboxylase] ligase [Anaerolineales bacterium]